LRKRFAFAAGYLLPGTGNILLIALSIPKLKRPLSRKFDTGH